MQGSFELGSLFGFNFLNADREIKVVITSETKARTSRSLLIIVVGVVTAAGDTEPLYLLLSYSPHPGEWRPSGLGYIYDPGSRKRICYKTCIERSDEATQG